MFRVRSVRAWGPSTGPTACALAGRRCSLWGWRKGVPGGDAFPHCEGRLSSGAVPSPAVGVSHPRAVVVGVWVWGPNTVPLACMPCGGCVPRGWWGAVPGGLACQRCGGHLVSGAVPPPAVPQAWSGCPSGSPRVPFVCVCSRAPAASAPPPLGGVAWALHAVPALGAGRAVPRGPCPFACPAPVPCSVWRAWGGAVRSRFPPTWLCLHALWGLRAAGVVAGRPPGGGGPPPLSVASGVRRRPSPDRPSSGAGSRGTTTHVFRLRLVRVWRPSTGPTACALAGRRCLLWGWRIGVPGGVPSTIVRGV